MILKRRENENHGQCWFDAVKDFEVECGELTEKLQVELAMRFANCFLEMTDQSHIPCGAEKKDNLRRICFEEMNDRSFLTFTEFYTHTQNMCFFLRNQLWNRETEKTIDMLSAISNEVAMKLVQAEHQQEELLSQQKVGLELQKQIYDTGTLMSRALIESRRSLEELTNDFRTTTIENNQIFFEIFGRIQSIQNWLLGDYSVFGCIVFFSALLAFYLILTSSMRTATSRLPLLTLLSVNIVIEYCIRFLVIGQSDGDILEEKYRLDFITWTVRKLFVALGLIVCGFNAIKFRDINERNNRILQDLIKQNEMITTELSDLKLVLTNAMRGRRPSLFIGTIPVHHPDEPSSFHEISVDDNELSAIEDESTLNNSSTVSRRRRRRVSSTPINFITNQIGGLDGSSTRRYSLRQRSISVIPE